MLFIIENYEVKASRNRKSGSEIEKNNRKNNCSYAAESSVMTNLDATRNISVGRIF